MAPLENRVNGWEALKGARAYPGDRRAGGCCLGKLLENDLERQAVRRRNWRCATLQNMAFALRSPARLHRPPPWLRYLLKLRREVFQAGDAGGPVHSAVAASRDFTPKRAKGPVPAKRERPRKCGIIRPDLGCKPFAGIQNQRRVSSDERANVKMRDRPHPRQCAIRCRELISTTAELWSRRSISDRLAWKRRIKSRLEIFPVATINSLEGVPWRM